MELTNLLKESSFPFLTETFADERDKRSDIYGVLVPDRNAAKKSLFECVDAYGDSIVHIAPQTLADFQKIRAYIYVKSHAATAFFADHRIPPEEIIHSIKFRDYFTVERFPETRTIYCKTDFLVNGRFKRWLQLNKPSKGIVLITGSSDQTIDKEMVCKFGSHVTHWFGTNMENRHPKCTCIPIGISSYDLRTKSPSFLFTFKENSNKHQVLADDRCLTDLWTEPIPHPKSYKIYMNFNETSHPDRRRVAESFKDHPLVYVKPHNYTLDARKEYLKELRNAEFNLCPRGNGIDTHRFWESLYSGTVPLIERNRVYEEFAGLPFIQYDRLCKETCSEDTLVPPPFPRCYQKLYVSYWIERMERESVRLTHPS